MDPEYVEVVNLCLMMRAEDGGFRGVLPDGGGLFDQSAWLLSAYRVVNSAIAELIKRGS